MAHDSDDLRPAPDLVEDGIPTVSDAPPHVPVETTEGEVPPLDQPQAVNEWGVTPAEEVTDEPLELRLLREEPSDDAFDDDEGPAALAGDEDVRSAEEAALRVDEEPPGLSYSPDPGYLSDES